VKRFGFEFEGKTWHLVKLDQDKKDDVCDFMTAGRFRTCDRIARKGYRKPAEVEQDRQVAFVKWGSKAFLSDLHDEENAKKFLRALLEEEMDDATLTRLVISQKDEDSDLRLALARMAEDADPKAQTPPPSVPTPTGGVAYSDLIPSS